MFSSTKALAVNSHYPQRAVLHLAEKWDLGAWLGLHVSLMALSTWILDIIQDMTHEFTLFACVSSNHLLLWQSFDDVSTLQPFSLLRGQGKLFRVEVLRKAGRAFWRYKLDEAAIFWRCNQQLNKPISISMAARMGHWEERLRPNIRKLFQHMVWFCKSELTSKDRN